MSGRTRVLGLDPGLRRTGWGIVDQEGNRLTHVANGALQSDASLSLAERLVQLRVGLERILSDYSPNAAAVEESLSNRNASSTLKLGMARAVALLVPASAGLPVSEYLPMVVKKSVVGTGRADKDQVQMMVARLLPGCAPASADAADALAVSICHLHHASSLKEWVQAGAAP